MKLFLNALLFITLSLMIVSCFEDKKEDPKPSFKATTNDVCPNRIDNVFGSQYGLVWTPYTVFTPTYNMKVTFTRDTLFTQGDSLAKDKLIFSEDFSTIDVIKLDSSGPYDYYDNLPWSYKIYNCGDSLELFDSKNKKIGIYTK